MRYSGICGWWQRLRNGETSGQVAILITLAIAVIFLFVAITVNISKVAHKKTVTANAADGAVMLLTSYLGSLGNYLSQQYCDGKDRTDWNRSLGGFFAILGTIIACVLAYWTGGLSLYFWAALLAGAGSYYYQTQELPDKIHDAYQKEFAKMKPKDSFMEQSVFYALTLCVDDPAEVKDEHDIDQDDDDTEGISRFSEWYYSRLRELNGEGGEFAQGNKEDAVRDFVADVEEFAVRGNEFRRDFSEDRTRPLVEGGPAAGKDGALIILLEELQRIFEEEGQPFPVTFWRRDANTEANYDEVDMLSQNIFSFFLFALDTTENVEGFKEGFCFQDVQTLVNTMDFWIHFFYPTGDEAANAEDAAEGGVGRLIWYDIWQEDGEKIDPWQRELQQVVTQIEAMIAAETAAIGQTGLDIQGISQLIQDAIQNAESTEGLQQQLEELQMSLVERQMRLAYLNALKEQVEQAITNLEDFQERLTDFNADIEEMYAFWLQGMDENLAQRRQAVYSWQDSLGWHHARIGISDFAVPYIDHEKEDRWYGHKERLRLRNGSGTVWVEVTRYDQGTATAFARRGRSLWDFRYTKDAGTETAIRPDNPEQALAAGITSKATADYSYRDMPRIVSVDK